MLLFIIISLVLLLFTRPIAVKYINQKREKTNYEGLIGKVIISHTKIDNYEGTGSAFINDVEWTARSSDDSIILMPETKIKIIRIEGVKLIVEELKDYIKEATLIVIILLIFASCIKIVPQANSFVVERLGGYQGSWAVGVHFKVPFIDRIARKVSLKEQVADFDPQPVITKDNVTMQIDTVVFYQITDPKLFAYGVENPIKAIENLTATTLRNIIGDLELDQTLTSREVINTKMRVSLDVATDPWGIKVNRVELKNIIPPATIRDAMEKQMKAERERRESILRAEGEKTSTILVAEGKKESAILEAEGEKMSAILRAEATKEAVVKEAEGEAQAIIAIQKANAEGIEMINKATPSKAVIQLKSLEAFAKAADGKATKIIIPSEIQGFAGLAKSLFEIDEKGERIPLTICDYNREAGTVTIVFQTIGASTKMMAEYEEGEYFRDFTGPLGQRSELINEPYNNLINKNILFVAGGVGTAPVYPQVKWAKEAGLAVDCIIGARNKELIILEDEMKKVAANTYVATDDGSYGFKGNVNDKIRDLIQNKGKRYDLVVAIGPVIMMKYVSLLTKELGIKTIVSMNPIMVDGTGMCGACRLSVGGEVKFACVDGPEFDGHLINYDEAMKRQMIRIPVKEQEPEKRVANFEEVCLGYNKNEAIDEAKRCLKCKNPKCREGCPVNIDIPGFINEIENDSVENAYKVISRYSSLPAVCGRVCPQEVQCEARCIRGIKGDPIAIGRLERFATDWARENYIKPDKPKQKKEKKTAVIGSGPAGLTCAGELARLGYEVTVFEALHEPGGVLVYGIPEFRLPKEDVVAKEIENIKSLGVKFETNVVVGKTITIDELMEEEGFEAVFIGTGAGLPKFMGIPGENANGVFSANEYLTRNNLMKAFRDDYDTPIATGKKVYIVYRRSEAELPARAEEVHHAKEEGIIFELLTNPVEITVDENGWVNGMKCIRMELLEPDASGRRRPVEIIGSDFLLELDTVIMSLGTSPNPLISSSTEGLNVNKHKCIIADEATGRTTKEGVYAGGDAVTGVATVILAMGAGKAAAKGIDEYLSNK
ncbi:fad nadph dehydrogenase/oxidoreductase [Holotrichia oblita]|nr:fad nadph dehydrogenase/oxidoreductase [Holotrichia oblita]